MKDKPKILFIYEMWNESEWKDGLWAAIKLLEKDFDISRCNLATTKGYDPKWADVDFVLGWGGFDSTVDLYLRKLTGRKKGLCVGGYGFPAINPDDYNVLFYECEWAKNWLKNQKIKSTLIHAFGVNTDIYFNEPNIQRIWKYLTVGSFSSWKRQELILEKDGTKMAVGEIQIDNLGESLDIVGRLVLEHCGVSDAVSAKTLAKMYNSSLICYIPANVVGGGERAILEARACGIEVEVEDDNPKLKELTTGPIWDHHYYYEQLKKGINLCLKT